MENNLRVVEQKTVLFYDDVIVAVRVKDGTIYIPIKPICELLGVSWSAQRKRINRDPVLAQRLQGVSVMTTPSADGRGGGVQSMSCLPLDFVNGFLFGINANRVNDDVRGRLIRYQEECYKVLSEAFFEGRLSADDDFESLLQNSDNPAVQAYKTFQALAKLARHQLILESRLDTYEERLERIEAVLGDPAHHISPSQASQISQAVKAIALVLGKRTGRNEYGGVYGEFYRQFGVTSYKQLPTSEFATALEFLTEWHRSLVDDVPF